MHNRIVSYLKEIEQKHDITILFACESGSRAWGFASKDSDWDIRFVYKRDIKSYLSVSEQKDSIELMLENNLVDIGGWELKKSLKLMYSSNVALFEWINSPIVYIDRDNFIKRISNLSEEYFSPISTYYHYLKLYERSFIDEQEMKLKKLFYAMRGLLCTKSVAFYGSLPPVIFADLLEKLDLPIDIMDEIAKLLILKKEINEDYEIAINPVLIDFLKSLHGELLCSTEPEPHIGNIQSINNFFYDEIM